LIVPENALKSMIFIYMAYCLSGVRIIANISGQTVLSSFRAKLSASEITKIM
jgi:hypothetical protein